MKWSEGIRQPGVAPALLAALLFGAGTPIAKLLLLRLDPWLLAGLLYLGSGLGLGAYRAVSRAPAARLPRGEWPWLLGAIVSGGVIAPVLLMLGLTRMPASGASLLLNGESVFTALLAWFAFRENFDRRIAFGMLAIVAGALLLSWPGEARFAGWWPALAVFGACLAWGVDNNLTRKVSLSDATWIAATKGLSAGVVNLLLALVLGASLPAWPTLLAAGLLGLATYGVSLALFVVGLRHLGAARTGAYYAVAPFFGALLALFMGDALTLPLVLAAVLMAVGVWLHLTESHEHPHSHPVLEHEHEHVHDAHHQHRHDAPVPAGVSHVHAHRHEPLTHAHRHFPDSHHSHNH